jgi:cation diffusion facilitator family transporter
MESIVNVIAGFISLYAIHKAAIPKDEDHPFGHGKIELISASIEGILILLAGGIIIYEAVQRLFSPSVIEKLDTGIIVIAVAGVINYILGWYSIHQGKKYDSVALVAGGKHLQSDTYSTIGLVAGLTVLYFTGLSWIDSALAIVFGGIIAFTGINILRKTINNLIDTADVEALEKITGSVNENRKDDWIDIHNLKVLEYGSDHFVDCDLILPWYYNITEGHRSCEELRMSLVGLFPQDTLVSIHSDSCLEKYCPACQLKDCRYRKESFIKAEPFTTDKLIRVEES